MKNRNLMASPFAPLQPRTWFSVGDRGAALALLSAPFAIALITFVLAVLTTMLGEMEKGSARFYTAAFSYTFLISSVMALPAYLAGYGWYWWWTKESDDRLTTGLWFAPLVATLFAWFPATLFPATGKLGAPAINPFQTYLLIAALTLVLGYLWASLVRVILRLWRNI